MSEGLTVHRLHYFLVKVYVGDSSSGFLHEPHWVWSIGYKHHNKKFSCGPCILLTNAHHCVSSSNLKMNLNVEVNL